MRVWPVILDSQHSYLQRSDAAASLLLAPAGAKTVLEHVCALLESATRNAPIVLSPFAGDRYCEEVVAVCPSARVLSDAPTFLEAIAAFELSDALLIVDPQCLPRRDVDLADLLAQYSSEPRVAHHLVAFESTVAGTMERVSFDAVGNVRGIHRYYEPATWPFVAGVAALIVPVSCGAVWGGVPRSLAELRRALVTRGVPTRDVPIDGGALDLTKAREFLAATEQLMGRAEASPAREGWSSASCALVGIGQSIDASARLVGHVVVHEAVTIAAHATVIGPAVIGPRARIEQGAVVAHAVIGPGTTVQANTTLRDGVFFGGTVEQPDAPDEQPQTYRERLVHLTADNDAYQQPVVRGRRLDMALKRALDITVAATALLLLLPVMSLAAVMVWLESRRPIFYGDLREGRGGRVFKCWKFRTMFVGAHAAQQQLKALDHTDGPHFKVARDPRVTRVGRVLRALNLDELPQLFNVLRGEMSLVGPRPSPFRENQLCIPWREARLSVRPGITGLWQVCRHNRSAGDFHQWIEYDLLYVQHHSFWLDLKIIVATVATGAGKLHVPAPWMVRASTIERASAPTAASVVRAKGDEDRQVA